LANEEEDNIVLAVKELYAGYGRIKILHGINLELRKGTITVLLGPNGNGKSTLLKCLSGMLRPDAGDVILNIGEGRKSISLIGRKPYEVVEKGVSLVPEGRRLFGNLSVFENLAMGAFNASARKNLKTNLNRVYELFPILKERKNQLAYTLSGGEQQMLALGRGLMSNPKILLIDEPSIGLAPVLVSRVMAAVKELRDKFGLSILMTEQNLLQASKIADKGYVMIHGKIVSEAESGKLMDADFVKSQYLSK